MTKIEQKYLELKDKSSDINEHLPILRFYSEQSNHVTEMGVRWIVSTWAFLAGKPKKLVSIDIKHPNHFGANLDEVIEAAKASKIDFEFKLEDTTKNEIEETDLLFIDTWHCYSQLKEELKRHANKVRKYIILHDTITFGKKGEDGGEGILQAILEFIRTNKKWKIQESYTNNNGLLVLIKSK